MMDYEKNYQNITTNNKRKNVSNIIPISFILFLYKGTINEY